MQIMIDSFWNLTYALKPDTALTALTLLKMYELGKKYNISVEISGYKENGFFTPEEYKGDLLIVYSGDWGPEHRTTREEYEQKKQSVIESLQKDVIEIFGHDIPHKLLDI